MGLPKPPDQAVLAIENKLLMCGHGSFNKLTDSQQLTVTVPNNVFMVFWVQHGEGLADSVGTFLDGGDNLEALPGFLNNLRQNRVNVAFARGGKTTKLGTHSMSNVRIEIVSGGNTVKNYRLTAPTGLAVKPQHGNDRIVVVAPHPSPNDANIAQRSLSLADFFSDPSYQKFWQDSPTAVHWCACRSERNR